MGCQRPGRAGLTQFNARSCSTKQTDLEKAEFQIEIDHRVRKATLCVLTTTIVSDNIAAVPQKSKLQSEKRVECSPVPTMSASTLGRVFAYEMLSAYLYAE